MNRNPFCTFMHLHSEMPLAQYDFEKTVTLALRHADDPSRSTTVFVGKLRMAVTIAASLPPETRERAVILGPGLPVDGIPPPPFHVLAAQSGAGRWS